MFYIPAETFGLSSEAVVLLRAGRIAYANSQAIAVLGSDCVGKSVKEVFGSEVSDSQASCFTVDVCIEGKYYTACVSRSEQYHVLFLHRQSSAADYIGERFWLSIRDGLMNFGLSLELWRARCADTEDEALKKSVAAMSKSYYRMSRMVSNVSYVMENGGFTLSPVPAVFSISRHCSQLVDTLSHLYPEIDFSFNCSEEMTVCADSRMLDTALLNLYSNSLLHAAGCSHISLSLSQTKDSIIISLSDDGCGIEPDRMHSVFCRYREGLDLCSGGAGFGLTVARNIARMCDGTLLLESRSGHGITVRMSLSRRLSPALLSQPEEYSVGMRPILEAMADSLPIEAFLEKYMD